MASDPSLAATPLTVVQARRQLMERIMGSVDARLEPLRLLREAEAAKPPPLKVPASSQVALVGHRGAGKSRLLRLLCAWCGRPGVDLDQQIEKRHNRTLQSWFAEDPLSFRAAERETFSSLPPGQVVSCGGGFLSLHSDLLEGHVSVVIPISFLSYRERLSRDRRRPRLHPELSLEEELEKIFTEREALHARVPTLDLATFLLRTLHVEKSFS